MTSQAESVKRGIGTRNRKAKKGPAFRRELREVGPNRPFSLTCIPGSAPASPSMGNWQPASHYRGLRSLPSQLLFLVGERGAGMDGMTRMSPNGTP